MGARRFAERRLPGMGARRFARWVDGWVDGWVPVGGGWMGARRFAERRLGTRIASSGNRRQRLEP